ncbi:MAG: sulfotransferase family protein [Rhodobacteraceae bacterium]|nr:sulfotransferase family protein [Paracoccaceae bacterium]
MTLKVIGTGFGRTGTDSMREALGLLGFGPCHHMYEVIGNPEQKARWRAMVAGGPRDWSSLLEGYAACVDWPTAAYWRELIEIYPEAKVILTWRTPESWWDSFSRTILKGISTSDDPASVGKALIERQIFDGRMGDRDHALALYRANVDAVLAEVPPGRLLVHRLGDGWAPLCAHLGVPVPDMPYPHGNTAAEFHARVERDGRS